MFEIIDLLQGAMANPWMLLFLAIWGIGFFVKEYTPLDSSRVPWIVLPVGIALGVALIEVSLAGAIIGGVMALAQMGFYDVVKPVLNSIPVKTGEGGITVDGAGEDDEQ